jgi:hypothetical protein
VLLDGSADCLNSACVSAPLLNGHRSCWYGICQLTAPLTAGPQRSQHPAAGRAFAAAAPVGPPLVPSHQRPSGVAGSRTQAPTMQHPQRQQLSGQLQAAAEIGPSAAQRYAAGHSASQQGLPTSTASRPLMLVIITMCTSSTGLCCCGTLGPGHQSSDQVINRQASDDLFEHLCTADNRQQPVALRPCGRASRARPWCKETRRCATWCTCGHHAAMPVMLHRIARLISHQDCLQCFRVAGVPPTWAVHCFRSHL